MTRKLFSNPLLPQWAESWLYDPNRHTRALVLSWAADGTPDFGEPVPDARR